MSIASKIEILDKLRKELARNINTMGVSSTETEGFDELVPKVLQIENGGEGATIKFAPCRSDRTFVNLQPPVSPTTEFFLQSDTLLNPTLTVEDFEVTDNIVEIKYVNELAIKVVCANPLVYGEILSIKAKSSAYLNQNGESVSWKYNVRNKLEDYYFNKNGMIFLSKNTKTDSGGWTTNSTIKVPCRTNDDKIRDDLKNYITSGSWIISSDCYVYCSSNYNATINIDRRDNSSYNVSYCGFTTSDCGNVLKIRWEGMDPYGNASVNLIWELFLLANGDIIIIHEKNPTSSFNGSFSVYNTGYTKPTENKTFYSFYAKDSSLNSYTIVQEPYDIRLHNESCDFKIPEGELSDFIGNRNGLMAMVRHAKHDTINYTFTFNDIDWDWFYNGTKITKILANGDSYINLNDSSCYIGVSGRDASICQFWMNVLTLSEWNLKCMKVVWYGSSYYSGAIDHEWEVYLFSNGDAMIHITKFGAYTGTNNFLGVGFNPSAGANISFYRKNNEGTSWQVEYDIYDPNKHLI